MIALNILSLHLRSTGGFLEGIGVLNDMQDDIRAVGFPFLVWKEGGFAYRYEFPLSGLAGNLAIALALAVGVGIAVSRRRISAGQT